MTRRDKLLIAILQCGGQDLQMLDSVGYDFNDVIDQLDDIPIQEVGINDLMKAVVDVGIIHIREAVDDRICELEAIPNERELNADEEKELAALNTLNPDEDIRGFYNGLNTSVWFRNNGSVYRRYLDETVKDFERNTGLRI